MTRFLIAIGVASVAGPLGAQARPEAGVAVVGVASDPAFLGGGPSLRLEVAREVGILLTTAVGRRHDAWAGRGELALQYRFLGRTRRRPSWYLGGGVAGTTGRSGGSYLLAGVGVELPVGARRGFWVETGVGGGVRLVAGFRSLVGNDKRPP